MMPVYADDCMPHRWRHDKSLLPTYLKRVCQLCGRAELLRVGPA